MGVVETCNGHFVLLIDEGLLFPDMFVMEWVQFPEGFFVGVDFDVVVENVLGSELLAHAQELSQELTSQGPKQFLQQVNHLLATINPIVPNGYHMLVGRNEPRFYDPNLRIEFFSQLKVYQYISLSYHPILLGHQLLFNPILLLINQLKV